MARNECSVAASYYDLYANAELTTAPPSNSPANEDGDEQTLWEEYEWTAEDEQKVADQLQKSAIRCKVVPSFRVEDGKRSWDDFYGRHQVNFFKDRHYLATAFPQEFGPTCSANPCLVELGCGVGNALLPLLEDTRQRWTVYGMDLSEIAIALLKQDTRFTTAAVEGRAFAFAGDLSCGVPEPCRGVATVASLLFCLSAIPPAHQAAAARHAAATLGPGSVLVLRDYGRFDEAQVKLGSQRNRLITDNYYRKYDGTKCFYFSLHDLERLFVQEAGLDMLELDYIRRVYSNRAQQSTRRRVWVHARFRKPLDA
jgi:methyltransferase-like protein 6